MSDDTTSIPVDEDGKFDAEAAFLARLTAGREDPSEEGERGTEAPKAETPKSPETNTDEKDDDKAETTDDETQASDEDPEVEVKVGEETHKVKVSALTRLYGQEAALTRKSQEVAQARQNADAQAMKATAALTKLVEKAAERYRPYSEMDFLVLAQRVDADTLQQVRQDALEAANDYKFLTEELNGVQQQQAQAQRAATQADAAETIRQFSQPVDKGGIEGWGPELYKDLVGYMVKAGIPNERAHAISAAAPLRLAHKAMLWDKSQEAAATAQGKVKQAVLKSTKVLKAGNGAAQRGQNTTDAMKRLARTGSIEDAQAAFMDRIRNRE